MRIAVTGASGLIGTAVVRDLVATGHDVLRLVRHLPAAHNEVHWDPARGVLDAAPLDGITAAVHLAGENLAAGRWTAARKARIHDSRILGTHLLSTTLAALTHPPKALICASALGWYGDRGDEILSEASPPGTGFLPETCRAWEQAADPARTGGIRVVHLRFGLVLDPSGGALARMLPVFRLGLGAPLGSGRQWWSWITLQDLVAIVRFVLERDLPGAVNAVAPAPVTNAEFTRVLCRTLRRPMLPAVPRFVLRLLLGEMADSMLLTSARLEPARLRAAGYTFRHPELEPALGLLLHRV
jgi:uncharacterized protein (TIGR01777 family)